eukprot:Hpha_TRINITY_DN15494_c2_g7::TRINITY_DN15494_c2_g7_i1::g.177206::m.177206
MRPGRGGGGKGFGGGFTPPVGFAPPSGAPKAPAKPGPVGFTPPTMGGNAEKSKPPPKTGAGKTSDGSRRDGSSTADPCKHSPKDFTVLQDQLKRILADATVTDFSGAGVPLAKMGELYKARVGEGLKDNVTRLWTGKGGLKGMLEKTAGIIVCPPSEGQKGDHIKLEGGSSAPAKTPDSDGPTTPLPTLPGGPPSLGPGAGWLGTKSTRRAAGSTNDLLLGEVERNDKDKKPSVTRAAKVSAMCAERCNARNRRDYALSDALLRELRTLGVTLNDTTKTWYTEDGLCGSWAPKTEKEKEEEKEREEEEKAELEAAKEAEAQQERRRGTGGEEKEGKSAEESGAGAGGEGAAAEEKTGGEEQSNAPGEEGKEGKPEDKPKKDKEARKKQAQLLMANMFTYTASSQRQPEMPPQLSAREESRRRPGDWDCGKCGSLNFANRHQCYKCDAGRPAKERQDSGGKKVARNASGAKASGDWVCDACGNHNFAVRDQCRKCNGKRPPPPVDTTSEDQAAAKPKEPELPLLPVGAEPARKVRTRRRKGQSKGWGFDTDTDWSNARGAKKGTWGANAKERAEKKAAAAAAAAAAAEAELEALAPDIDTRDRARRVEELMAKMAAAVDDEQDEDWEEEEEEEDEDDEDEDVDLGLEPPQSEVSEVLTPEFHLPPSQRGLDWVGALPETLDPTRFPCGPPGAEKEEIVRNSSSGLPEGVDIHRLARIAGCHVRRQVSGAIVAFGFAPNRKLLRSLIQLFHHSKSAGSEQQPYLVVRTQDKQLRQAVTAAGGGAALFDCGPLPRGRQLVLGNGGRHLHDIARGLPVMIGVAQPRAGGLLVGVFGCALPRAAAHMQLIAAYEAAAPGYYTGPLHEHHPEDRDWAVTVLTLADPLSDLPWLIGEKGHIRTKISRASGCAVSYVSSCVLLCGTYGQRDRARDYIKWVSSQASDASSAPGSDSATLPFDATAAKQRDDCAVVDVPRDCRGIVVGHKRKTLSQIEQDAGVFCSFLKPPASGHLSLGVFAADPVSRLRAEALVLKSIAEKSTDRYGRPKAFLLSAGRLGLCGADRLRRLDEPQDGLALEAVITDAVPQDEETISAVERNLAAMAGPKCTALLAQLWTEDRMPPQKSATWSQEVGRGGKEFRKVTEAQTETAAAVEVRRDEAPQGWLLLVAGDAQERQRAEACWRVLRARAGPALNEMHSVDTRMAIAACCRESWATGVAVRIPIARRELRQTEPLQGLDRCGEASGAFVALGQDAATVIVVHHRKGARRKALAEARRFLASEATDVGTCPDWGVFARRPTRRFVVKRKKGQAAGVTLSIDEQSSVNLTGVAKGSPAAAAGLGVPGVKNKALLHIDGVAYTNCQMAQSVLGKDQPEWDWEDSIVAVHNDDWTDSSGSDEPTSGSAVRPFPDFCPPEATGEGDQDGGRTHPVEPDTNALWWALPKNVRTGAEERMQAERVAREADESEPAPSAAGGRGRTQQQPQPSQQAKPQPLSLFRCTMSFPEGSTELGLATEGVLVVRVFPGGCGDNVGVKAGMCWHQVNGRRVASYEEIMHALSGAPSEFAAVFKCGPDGDGGDAHAVAEWEREEAARVTPEQQIREPEPCDDPPQEAPEDAAFDPSSYAAWRQHQSSERTKGGKGRGGGRGYGVAPPQQTWAEAPPMEDRSPALGIDDGQGQLSGVLATLSSLREQGVLSEAAPPDGYDYGYDYGPPRRTNDRPAAGGGRGGAGRGGMACLTPGGPPGFEAGAPAAAPGPAPGGRGRGSGMRVVEQGPTGGW